MGTSKLGEVNLLWRLACFLEARGIQLDVAEKEGEVSLTPDEQHAWSIHAALVAGEEVGSGVRDRMEEIMQ
jgi:hypothetical protein